MLLVSELVSFVVVGWVVFRGGDGARCVARRELKEVMNSRAAGESPRRFFRWSALASFERLAE